MNNLRKSAQNTGRLVVLFLFFSLIIEFSGYQLNQAQAVSTLTTPPTPLCNITRDLNIGMTGTDVKELQKYLNNNGFPLAQTGVGSKGRETNFFGTLTKNAFVKLQKDNKIPATIGVFDSATKDFFGCEKPDVILPIMAFHFTRDLKFGMIGNDVKELQKYLNNNGFPLAQTGVGSKDRETTFFGTLTKDALTKFQIAKLQTILDSTKLKAESGNLFVDTRNIINGNQQPAPVPTLSYILTYTAGVGGTISGITSQTLKSGGNGLPVTATPNRGYYFTEWNDGSTINPRTDINITADKSIAANFAYRYRSGGRSSPSIATYTVTFDTNSGDGGSTATQTLNYNTATALTTNGFTKTGYTFAGWATTTGGVVTYADLAPYTIGAGNVTLYAKWTAASQTLTFESNGGSAVTAITQDFGTDISAPTAPTKSGYTFENWYNESGLTNVHTFTTMGLSTTVYAKWTINTYTVTFDTNGGNGGSTAIQTLNYNTPTALTANGFTKTGYTFAGWATTAEGEVTYADLASYTIGAGNVTLYAKWTIVPFACGDNVNFTYNGSPVTYGTVSNVTTGECWLDRNLGAARVAIEVSDTGGYGDLFQWGRPADGHQIRTSGTQSGQVATITPGTNTFIIPSSDWSSIDSDGALRSAYFAKTDGTGICPSGFRVPTETEINAERLSWSSNNSAGAFASPLKLTVAGGRFYNDGSLFYAGAYGYYWSSAVDGANSRGLSFDSGDAYMTSGGRAYSFSVRCLKD